MSPSSRPTAAPAWASATARLTLTVLLPTPPLPEATAMMFLTPGHELLGLARLRAADHRAPGDVDSLAPMPARTARALPSISSLSGQAGVVSSIVKATRCPSMAIDLTISSVTMSRPSSGSWTARRASRTAPSVRRSCAAGTSFCHRKCRNTWYRRREKVRSGGSRSTRLAIEPRPKLRAAARRRRTRSRRRPTACPAPKSAGNGSRNQKSDRSRREPWPDDWPLRTAERGPRPHDRGGVNTSVHPVPTHLVRRRDRNRQLPGRRDSSSTRGRSPHVRT